MPFDMNICLVEVEYVKNSETEMSVNDVDTGGSPPSTLVIFYATGFFPVLQFLDTTFNLEEKVTLEKFWLEASFTRYLSLNV